MGLLDDRVVFITGAARGQGRAHAVVSAREGADVVLFDAVTQFQSVPYELPGVGELERTAAEVQALGRRALVVVGDVRRQPDLDAAVRRGIDELGHIDCLIANAGIWAMAPFWEISERDWREILDIDLAGPWRSAKAVAAHMMDRGEGSIVITASSDAIEPGGGYTHYTAAKHGVLGLMKSIALELAPFGVRANAISPGAVNSPMLNNQLGYDLLAGHAGGTYEDLIEGGRHFTALKATHLLEPERVAHAAVYLNSELAARVTGINISVDAGHTLLSGYNHDPVRSA